MNAALELQKAHRAALVAYQPLVSIVSSKRIVDSHEAPAEFPAIRIGEDVETAADLTMSRQHVDVFARLHVFSRAPGTEELKIIVGLMRNALAGVELAAGHRLVDHQVRAVRYLRDRDGTTGHAIVEVAATVETTP